MNKDLISGYQRSSAANLMIDGTESPERFTGGIDVSRWEPPEDLDYPAMFEAGYKYMAARCTVGNYYQDPSFDEHWQQASDAGFYRMPYLVVAPAAYDYGPEITAKQHMDAFLAYFDNQDRKAELPWVLDCELSRKKPITFITDLIGQIVEDCYFFLGRYPIIYTRQSWWDIYVQANPLWSQCPLWAARYSSILTTPWSDGYCKFRDWTSWVFWQWSSHGRVPGYSGDMDLNRFNGDLTELALFASNVSKEMQLQILWREAKLIGWNLEP